MLLQKLTALCAGLLVVLALAGCDVDVKDEGELPDVDVEMHEGEMPDVDVETPDVDVETETQTIETPDIDVDTEETEVQVPDVDIDIPEENDNE